MHQERDSPASAVPIRGSADKVGTLASSVGDTDSTPIGLRLCRAGSPSNTAAGSPGTNMVKDNSNAMVPTRAGRGGGCVVQWTQASGG
jgi:hypothetical protein